MRSSSTPIPTDLVLGRPEEPGRRRACPIGHTVEVSDLYGERFNRSQGATTSRRSQTRALHYQSEQISRRGRDLLRQYRARRCVRKADVLMLQFPL